MDNECSICLEPLDDKDDENPSKKPHRLLCGHEIHQACYDLLVRSGYTTCPLCLQPMNENVVIDIPSTITDGVEPPRPYRYLLCTTVVLASIVTPALLLRLCVVMPIDVVWIVLLMVYMTVSSAVVCGCPPFRERT
jgi:hypothetical protein